jgi:hypothetical protein
LLETYSPLSSSALVNSAKNANAQGSKETKFASKEKKTEKM